MLDPFQLLFPEPLVIGIITPVTIICIISFLYISGFFKLNNKIKTNYTRKLFHILVFTGAGAIGFFFDHRAVMFYGGITGLIMIYVLHLGEGHILFEGIAREQDEPHRRFYIGVPLICTALGGLVNSYLFGSLAIVGYLVGGWGDAIGEPVGVRFGKHRYKVPSLRNVHCERSLDGSIAIALMSTLAVIVGLWLIGCCG